MSTARTLGRVVASVVTSDGAGVRLRRSLGRTPDSRLDPFLLLDEFFSDDPRDYQAGFPAHPHRGFETVTYMLDGHLRHEDHLGNRGDLGPGGVQWMTAGRGIVHSEMPLQLEGRMRGFQLWLNLPARDKLKPPSYRDIAAGEIPRVDAGRGALVKVIAGTVMLGGTGTTGPVSGTATEPLYLDAALEAGAALEIPVDADHNAFVYPYEGGILVGPIGSQREVAAHYVGVLTPGERIAIQAREVGARCLILTGRPLGEPIAQYGPFVMNTPREIEQAIDDYRTGRLTEP